MFKLKPEKTGLLLIDVQERLFAHVERACEAAAAMEKVLRGFKILGLPVFATEQYPEKMGRTIEPLRKVLGEGQIYHPKTSFSCMGDAAIRQELLAHPAEQWVVVGIEAHVCVLQTARDLAAAGMEAAVLNDAITSRSIYDYSTAIAEMRDMGVRISSVETVLFELLGGSKAAKFKEISQLIK